MCGFLETSTKTICLCASPSYRMLIAANARMTASLTLLVRTVTGFAASGTAYEAISRMDSPVRAAIRFTSFLGLKKV